MEYSMLAGGITILFLKISEIDFGQGSIIAATIVSLTLALKTFYEARKVKNEGLGNQKKSEKDLYNSVLRENEELRSQRNKLWENYNLMRQRVLNLPTSEADKILSELQRPEELITRDKEK